LRYDQGKAQRIVKVGQFSVQALDVVEDLYVGLFDEFALAAFFFGLNELIQFQPDVAGAL